MVRGNWIQTFTGRQYWPYRPSAADVHIMDIAHALSMQCRYTGHTSRFYSVAEHCVLISKLASEENALWGLLHDACEAYVSDVSRPLKPFLSNFKEVEERNIEAIAEAFGLKMPIPDEIHELDLQICHLEKHVLMKDIHDLEWDLPPRSPKLNSVYIKGHYPTAARNRFMLRFFELTDMGAEREVV